MWSFGTLTHGPYQPRALHSSIAADSSLSSTRRALMRHSILREAQAGRDVSHRCRSYAGHSLSLSLCLFLSLSLSLFRSLSLSLTLSLSLFRSLSLSIYIYIYVSVNWGVSFLWVSLCLTRVYIRAPDSENSRVCVYAYIEISYRHVRTYMHAYIHRLIHSLRA